MEFNHGNINLTDDELDRLLCLDDNDDNKLITSTEKNKNMIENNEEFLGTIFSRSSQFQISKNSPNFDSGNESFDLCNTQFMEMNTSECINLCTRESENKLSNSALKKMYTEKSTSFDKKLSANRNYLSSSLNTNFQLSIPIIPESLGISPSNFIYGNALNHSNDNFFNNMPNCNQSITKSSHPTISFLSGKDYISASINDVSSQKDVTHIPVSIMELYQSVRSSYSDFAFVYAISAQMCQEFIPMNCYLNLKMSLILSITSLSKNNQNDKPIQIVAIGPDSTLINRIMLHFGHNIPQRFLAPIDDLQNIGGTLTNENMIEAGPAILAKGGICYLGDWYHIKTNHADKILKEIEHGKLCIDKLNMNYPLECSIWCYWTGSFKNNVKDQKTLNAFMEIFGIPVMLDAKADGNILIDYILEHHQPSNNIIDDELSISLNDMKEFIKIVANRTVNFNAEALDIMKKYFIASRIDRPECLTQQSFTTLKKYSESFAKLSLRYDVIAADVIASIYLAENSIQNIFGFGIYPSPQFTSVNNCIGEVDSFMVKFENWLKDYIKRFN